MTKIPCWIVWEAATDGGRPYLLAVDTSEELATRHVSARKEEARLLDKPPPLLSIEPSWLDHRYGESMSKDFDVSQEMLRERLSTKLVRLRARFAHAITLARAAYMRGFHTFDDAQDRLDEIANLADLANLEKDL